MSPQSSLLCPCFSGRVDSTTIASDVTEYTLSRLQSATKYEINLSSLQGREESERVSIIVYTGGGRFHHRYTKIRGCIAGLSSKV